MFYSFDNLEEFTGQIEHLEENLKRSERFLGEYKDCYNELRIGHVDVSDIPIERISKAYIEVSNRVNLKVLERMIDREMIKLLILICQDCLLSFSKA
ncbi:hypothetical protein CW734_00505 (plasmid) [Planococcus sp. MB-3u-03]|nr:hypothetical protein CW734_00505 [Planococcus sp. MB-3u-03]